MAPPRRAAAVSAASNLAASASSNRIASQSMPKGSSSNKQNGKQSQKEANSDVPVASSSKPPPPVIPLSPIVSRLRTMWKFAAICQFLFTFDEAFGFSGFESDALENDLNGPENQVIPDLFRRLLYTLTLNRTIDEANWEDHLRKQYLNRDPDSPLLGTIEEPRSWHALPLQQKVESIHTLCEWQLWDAEKFRKLVKNEEDAEVWRIDPIGWDAEDNTYWLFDDNRLWIQHPPPTPPPAAKAKAPPKKSSKKAKAEARREAQKRKREAEANASASNLGTPAKSSRSTPAKPSARLPRTPPTRSSPRSRLANGESLPKQQRSTRTSRRTGDWEEIPAELLYDGDSDLSDPPEDDITAMEVDTTAEVDMKNEGDESEAIKEEDLIEVGEAADTKAEEDSVKEEDPTNAINGVLKDEENGNIGDETDIKEEPVQSEVNEWIEFETLAITRQEWEWMSNRFAKSRHPDEKALHKLLKDTVLPKVIADLDEADKQKAHELAMANRKRSSRIALKESEREEKERDRIARQKMEEKMAAIRAEEDEKVRKEQEEANMIRIREERLHEREARLMAREREAEERVQREIDEKEERERLRELRKLKREQIIANGGQPPDDDQDLDTKDDDSWELDCEVCGRNGINLDDTDEIVCCEQCGKWQHTECWNAFDRKVGRSKRDWENEDFYCSNCRPPLPGQPRPQPPTFQSFVQQSASTQSSKANTPVVPSQRSPVQETFSYPSAAAYSAERNERQQNSFPNYTTLYGNYQNNVQQPSHYTYQPPQQQSNYRPFPPPMQTMQGQPQFAQRPMMNSMQAPQSNAMSAPKVPQPFPGSGQHHPAANTPHPQQNVGSSQIRPTAPSPMTQQNAQSEQIRPLSASPNPHPTTQQHTGSQQNHSTPAPSPRPQQSVDNGQNLPPVAAAAAASSPRPQQNQTGSGKPNGSPSYNYPVRSPGSMNGGQSVPRNTQPSGSFPLRHTPARSPLSGPHRESPLSMPNMSIGPPVRSSSPSPMNRQSQQTIIPLTAGRPPQPQQQQQQLNNSVITSNSNQGPGPSSGSLARPSTMQPTNPIQHANGASQPTVNKSYPSPLAPVPDHVPQSTPNTTVPSSTTTTISNTAPQH